MAMSGVRAASVSRRLAAACCAGLHSAAPGLSKPRALRIPRLRGFRDVLGEDAVRYAAVEDTLRRVCAAAAFREIRTPLAEAAAVFARLGDTSEVVLKQMFHLQRGGDDAADNVVEKETPILRPEATAGVVRALVEAGLAQSSTQRVYYVGPMFRYERPQRGRYRQFNQFGVEHIGGGAAGPWADVSLIALAHTALDELGVAGRVKLLLNTLGDVESAMQYSVALRAFLQPFKERLSPLSQLRLDRGSVLRILDSSEPADITVISGAESGTPAPLLVDYLSPASAAHFSTVRRGLEELGVPFEVDGRLVRGLDYYRHTTFEFVQTDSASRQATVLAGGRYDGLVEQMGGAKQAKPCPAVGWAAGVDRLVALRQSVLGEQATAALQPRMVAVVTAADEDDDALVAAAHRLVHQLRTAVGKRRLLVPVEVQCDLRGGAAVQMARASRLGARAAVVIGRAELAAGTVGLRDLAAREQREVPVAECLQELLALLQAKDE